MLRSRHATNREEEAYTGFEHSCKSRVYSSRGITASHLTKLEEAGLVRIEKQFVGKRPNTSASLSAEGKRRIAEHWERLERLKSLGREGSVGGTRG